MNFLFKHITDSEIDTFIIAFKEAIGFELDRDYVISQGSVIGMYMGTQLVGGFIMVFKPGFRSLLFVPDAVKNSCKFLKKKSLTKCCEINGLWISKSLRGSGASIALWKEIGREILRSGKSHVLIMHKMESKGLEKNYSKLGIKYIFKGQSQHFTAQKTHDNISVGYLSRFNIILAFAGVIGFTRWKKANCMTNNPIEMKQAS